MSTIRPATIRRAALYRRVSTDDQVDGYSLDDQQRRGRAYIESRDWTLSGDYLDDGVSGTLRRRPALDRLLRDARAGKIDVVICTKLDRLARKLKVLLQLWDELEAAGVAVVIIEESIDSTTAIGRLVRNVLGAIAEFEVDSILARTSAGRAEKARRNEVWRSRPPLGYLYMPGDKQAGRPSQLEIDDAAAAIVREIFRQIAIGTSATALAAEFNARGIPTQLGGRWFHSTIRKIVINPVYHGRAAYGRYRYASFEDQDGRRRRRQRAGADEAIIYADAPAIVSPELAARAAAQLALNKPLSRRNSRLNYLLSGYLCCATCGRALSGLGPEAKRRYRCPGGCGTISAHRLETAVWDGLVELLVHPENAIEALTVRASGSANDATSLAAEIERLKKRIADVRAEREELLTLRLKKLVDDELYAGKDASLQGTLKALQARMDEVEEQRAAVLANVVPTEGIEAICQKLAERAATLDFAGQRRVLRRLVESITASRKRARVVGWLPSDEDTAGEPSDDDSPAYCGRVIVEPASPKRFDHPHPRLS